VVPSGPAAVAGIRSGDQVVRIGNTEIPLGGDIMTVINGQPIASFQELIVYLETETQVEDTVEVTLIRSGQEIKVSVTLAERAVTPGQS
jgi:S1-C subfamily serine protease